MASQRDVKNKIASVKNIQKITRAMEMVAAARLRRAEQRISALRPYADAIGRMTRQAAQAAGARGGAGAAAGEHESETNVGLLLVTGDRGLAGGFNSQIIRAGVRLSAEMAEEGLRSSWYATGRRGVSSLSFRGYELRGSYTGFADRPAYADARTIADDLIGPTSTARSIAWRWSTTPTSHRSPSTSRVRRCCRSRTRRSPASGTAMRMPGAPPRPRLTDLRSMASPAEARASLPEAVLEHPSLRAGPREDPQAIGSRLHRDLDLPRARGVHGRLLRRPDDGDAQRIGERRRNHHRLHTADEPGPPGRDHPGDHGGRRWRRGIQLGPAPRVRAAIIEENLNG